MSSRENKLRVLTRQGRRQVSFSWVMAFAWGFLIGSRRDDTKTTIKEAWPQKLVTREVHVGSMCRCPSGALPVPGSRSAIGRDTHIVQLPSKATGIHHSKHFFMHGAEDEGCTCIENSEYAEPTSDGALKYINMKFYEKRCPNLAHPSNYAWNEMPDFGVEDALPLFVAVLSYESPLSLNAGLNNWLSHDLFRRINAQNVMVQLNHRSQKDDEVLEKFQETLLRKQQSPLTIIGSAEDNLNPGLVISNMCREAEAHPASHPNGENMLLFLEKDWHISDDFPVEQISELFSSANVLSQRGVPYLRLSKLVSEVDKAWDCPSQGVPWICTNAHNHRYTNLPSLISCKWFLRYLEPFALMSDDPIMTGCGRGFQGTGYCDWEEAMQDGRIAWTNSQWVVAHLHPSQERDLFTHVEVDK